MKILALAILFTAASCAHRPAPLSDKPAQAESQIQSWVPVGTPLADAQRIMQQHNFTCSVSTNSSFGDLHGADFLYCDCHFADSGFTPIVYRVWKVALVLGDGKITGVRVSTGLVGP